MHFNFLTKYRSLLYALLAIITFFVLSPSLKNDFVRWDDHAYVTENDLIKEISFKNISKFGENVAGNFHPLTMITYAINYHFFKLDPFYYHLENLIYHILNTILVFLFVIKISKKNVFISFFTALIFGVHPMHVESVTWISERKDVLYTFFFLIGLILYYEYKQQKKIYLYILSSITFILSTLSKSAAVVFPVILILIDYYENKKLTIHDLKQKIPLFVISFIIGLKAIYTQTDTGAVEGYSFNIVEKFQYASNSFLTYIVKFIFPHELICFRPFPDIATNIKLFIFSVIVVLTFSFLLVKFRKKNIPLFFGFLFYFITIALVLQFIQVGASYISDRYSYMPYIGLGFVYFHYLERLIIKYEKLKSLILFIIIAQILIFSYYTFQQTKVWRNTIILWTNVIDVENTNINKSYGYDRRGNHYLYMKDTINALNDFTRSIEIGKYNFKAYTYRGALYYHLKEFDKSMNDFENALKLNSNWVDALKGKGAVYVEYKDYKQALMIFEKILALDQNNFESWNYLGFIYMQQKIYDKALTCFDKALELKNDFSEAIKNREYILALGGDNLNSSNLENLIKLNSSNFVALTGIGINYYKLKKYDLAMESLNKALFIKPDFDEALRTRAAIYWEEKQYDKAIEDITEYLKSHPDNFDMRNRRAICYVYLSQFQNAIKDFSLLIQSNPNNANLYQSRAFIYIQTGNTDDAIIDFLKAKELGLEIDENIIKQLQNKTLL